MKKSPLKSKTIDSALVIILITVMSLLGFGEEEIAKTYDTIGEKKTMETGKELITLLAAGGAIYGRYKVK
ncbi:unnamed protein product, partial [marine sediment metagenome]